MRPCKSIIDARGGLALSSAPIVHTIWINSSQHSNQFPLLLLHCSILTSDMGDHSGPTCFRDRFKSTLQAYQKITGIILAEHLLAAQLQSCHSIDSIITLLRYETRAFSDLQPEANDRITKSIESVVSIFYTLSTTASLGDAISLVRWKAR